jgi:hypothetical protein
VDGGPGLVAQVLLELEQRPKKAIEGFLGVVLTSMDCNSWSASICTSDQDCRCDSSGDVGVA